MLSAEDVDNWNTLYYFSAPFSMNKAYWSLRMGRGGTRRVLTKDAQAYKTYINNMTEYQTESDYRASLDDFDYLVAIYIFWDSFHYKNGSVKKKDVTNLVKITEDAVCESLGIDDRGFGDVHVHKIPWEGAPRFTVTIRGFKEVPGISEVYREVSTYLGRSESTVSLRQRCSVREDTGCSRDVRPHEKSGRRRVVTERIDGDPTAEITQGMVPF